MASEKNERLVNLVIALLATKKLLTKAQIFKAVAGYEGSAEATDRMFERDKEELRALGIEIEMQSIDPLFDDEIGYRILPDRYRFDLGPLTSEEISLLALAAQAWKESALKDVARTTSLRLESLGINSDFSEIPLVPTILNAPENLTQILDAIANNRILDFSYIGEEDIPESKRVAPLGIYSQNGRWYLYAQDQSISDFRSYRLDRISGEVKRSNKTFAKVEFELPKVHFPAVSTLLEIRRDSALDLLSRAEVVTTGEEWIRARIEFKSQNHAVAEILRNSPNVKILEPISLVSAVTKELERLAAIYGK